MHRLWVGVGQFCFLQRMGCDCSGPGVFFIERRPFSLAARPERVGALLFLQRSIVVQTWHLEVLLRAAAHSEL